MTSRLDAPFASFEREGRRVLIAYLCMGFPTMDESVELAAAAAEAGADVLELGVPFSDPTADGPAIARASEVAIRAGATLPRVIDAAGRLRARLDAPFVLFGYYNPIFVLGEEESVTRAARAGIDALLVVDLPPEEADPLRTSAARAGLALVPLIAPTTSPDRAARIAAALDRDPGSPRGFVYYVSMTGVTGSGATALEDARAGAVATRQQFGRPVVVGFGIDGAAAARAAVGPRSAPGPDGIVVGTAIVRRIERGRSAAERRDGVVTLVSELRAALDSAD